MRLVILILAYLATSLVTLAEGTLRQISCDPLDDSLVDTLPPVEQPGRPFQLRLLTGPKATEGTRQLFFLPLLAANAQNKLMAGLALHNRTREPRTLEWIVAPLYGFGSRSINGFGGLRWRVTPEWLPTPWRALNVEAGLQRFGYRNFGGQTFHYQRMGMTARSVFDHPAKEELASSLAVGLVMVNEEIPTFSPDGTPLGQANRNSTYYRLEYARRHERVINPRGLRLRLEAGFPSGPLTENFAKAEVEIDGGYQYQDDKFFRWRLFGGYFLQNELRDRNFYSNYAFSLVGNAGSDYAYDDLYLGRGDERSYGQQISRRQGGFRTPIDPAFGFGRSNDYLVALNLDADLPFAPNAFPLGLYLDAATYGRAPLRASGEAAFQWSGGISLSWLDGAVGLYVPILGSPQLRDISVQRGGLLQRIGFRLSFHRLLPRWFLDDEAR